MGGSSHTVENINELHDHLKQTNQTYIDLIKETKNIITNDKHELNHHGNTYLGTVFNLKDNAVVGNRCIGISQEECHQFIEGKVMLQNLMSPYYGFRPSPP